MLALLYSHFFGFLALFIVHLRVMGNYDLHIYIVHVYTQNDARNFNYSYFILVVVDSLLYSNQGTLLGLANLIDIVLGQAAAFLSLLNLLLVGLDLLLQFVHQLRAH